MNKLKLFIDGRFVDSAGSSIPVTDPATQEVLCEVPFATADEVDRAVLGAQAAFRTWREVPAPERARLLFAYQELLKRNQDDLARGLCRETGKTFEDARGEVWRGIEVVEHACGIASLTMGETVDNVARGIDTYSLVQPLGVCVGITPFNFPAMVPLWMFPIAIACGNAFVLKPSEQDPMTPNRLMELLAEAGAPNGLVQVVHGGKAQVDALLEHADVRAVSFVGSANVAKRIYRKAANSLKRVQALSGAKNHLVVMPDANKEQAIASLVGAACGAAGQRCMAVSAAVLVGAAAAWLPELKAALAAVRPGSWDDEGAGYGAQISRAARQRILDCIERGKAEGARCLLDGSDCRVPGYPDGNWVGPTLFADATPAMSIYREEIFGPVLVASQVDTLGDAIDLVNANPYGNGVSIFTSSGSAAVPARDPSGPGGRQHPHSGAAAVLLVHRLEGFVLRRPACLRQAGGALLYGDQDGHGTLVRRRADERAEHDHTAAVIGCRKAITRRFSSYGPVDAHLHFHVPRARLVDTLLSEIVGDNPGAGGNCITLWAPRQRGKTWVLGEAVYRFVLYSCPSRFPQHRGGTVLPEFPAGNGRIDLLVRYAGKTYALELKSITDAVGYRAALRQAARYGSQLGLDEITRLFFVDAIDDANRRQYEALQTDEETGVVVEPIFVETS